MFRFISVSLVALLAWPAAAASEEQGAAEKPAAGSSSGPMPAKRVDLQDRRASIVPGEVLVRFREGTRRPAARKLHADIGGRIEDRIPGFGVDVVQLEPEVSVADAIASYTADPQVEVAEPNITRSLLDVPMDSQFMDQWGHHNTGQPHTLGDGPPPALASGTSDADADTTDAWDDQDGDDGPGPRPIIAIVDTGIDVTHTDLNPNLWVNSSEDPGNGGLPGVDDDGNGYVDDVNGCNFNSGNCTNLVDSESHGTHVSGIAAADRDDLNGVVGACPSCQIMALKISDGNEIPLSAELSALAYARGMGANIVNLSLGGPEWSRLERDAIAGLRASGILAVIAAGNGALDNDLALGSPVSGDLSPSFPASYTLDNIISVAASNHTDEYGYFTACFAQGGSRSECLFTNWGHLSVDVAAPGVDIRSTIPVNAYDTYDGTSMSSPFVAGVAGLVKAEHPTDSYLAIRNRILNGVDRPPALGVLRFLGATRSGTFTRSGDGRVNADRALTASPVRFEGKNDGSIQSAKRIRRRRRGRIEWPNDVNDVYRRRLRPGFYRITLRGGERKDFDLYVWKGDATEIWQFEASCFPKNPGCKLRAQRTNPTANETIKQLRVTQRGRYYFHVSAYLFQQGKYRLRVRRVGSL